jgi:hypothetical protein
MPFKYIPAKDTKNGSDWEACRYNGNALAEGLVGIQCISVGTPTRGECIDYSNYIPWGCVFTTVERYANGAKNFFVENTKNVIVGYLIVRSLDKTTKK